jgi:regulatory Fis family protein
MRGAPRRSAKVQWTVLLAVSIWARARPANHPEPRAGSVSRAAEVLGVSRQALYREMEKGGVVLERRPR